MTPPKLPSEASFMEIMDQLKRDRDAELALEDAEVEDG
jgi:hypothetical protein